MITGNYLDGRTAASTAATVEFGDGTISVHGLEQPLSFPLASVRISERIANIPRRLAFINGAVFETDDNLAVDRACEAAGIQLRAGFVHWLESRWPVALVSMVAVVAIAFGFVRWGVPALADRAARQIPPEMDSALGKGTLELFDRYMFSPSRLPEERQTALWQRFMEMSSELDDGHQYALEFRQGHNVGANAFALPSGIVVITDELVNLAETDDEVMAVLAHEVGHVRERHALRILLRAAGLSSMAMALFGDVSSVTGLLGAAPMLLTAKYSRDFETEADEFARQWLRTQSIDESSFDAILCRIGESAGERSFLASHPPTEERARCDGTR